MTNKITIKDLAKLANVSVSTVSRSLQDHPKISEETKSRVRKIARENNFKINHRARNFRTQKCNVVGVLANLDHSEKQAASDQFLFSLINSISTNLKECQYDLLLHTSQSLTAVEASSYVENQKVDGIIIIGQGKNPHSEILKLTKMNVPFVVWGGYTEEEYTTVGSDNLEGTYLSTQHLINDSGKSNLVFLGNPDHHEIKLRYQGFCNAVRDLKANSVMDVADPAGFNIESGYNEVKTLLEKGVVFDGLVCASDSIALGALNCLKDHSVKVPEQVAVIGYDDISIAKYWSPSLTTMVQDTDLGGQLLVKKILAKINGEAVQSSQLPVTLIRRESS